MIGTNVDCLTAHLTSPDPALASVGSAAICFGLTVDATGKGQGIGVFRQTAKSKPLEAFIQNAVRKSTFQPAIYHGKRVTVGAVGTAVLSTVQGKPVVRAMLTIVPEAVAAQADVVDPQRVLDPKLSLRYPIQALRLGHTAQLRYTVAVNPDCTVKDASIAFRSAHAFQEFDDAVLDYARKSKYIAGWHSGGTRQVTSNRVVFMFTNSASSTRFVHVDLDGNRLVCQTSVGK